MENTVYFGNKLKEMRNAYKISISELSALTKVSTTTIWKMENGRSNFPKISYLIKLADCYSMPISKLFEFIDDQIKLNALPKNPEGIIEGGITA